MVDSKSGLIMGGGLSLFICCCCIISSVVIAILYYNGAFTDEEEEKKEKDDENTSGNGSGVDSSGSGSGTSSGGNTSTVIQKPQITDPGYPDDDPMISGKSPKPKRGWYDLTGSGAKNNYCRFAGDNIGSKGVFWSCIMASDPTNLYNESIPVTDPRFSNPLLFETFVAETPSKKLDTWTCIPNLHLPIRKNSSTGHIECLSTDAQNCMWKNDALECDLLKNNLPANIRPLSCGPAHKAAYPSDTSADGYGSVWCTQGRNFFA